MVLRVMEGLLDKACDEVDASIQREKDPFTVNDFLTQHINKIRYDRFDDAVEGAFRSVKAGGDKLEDIKGEVGVFMKHWYKNTHGINSTCNAEDMSVILEAYWLLAAKRFVDQACMVIDRDVLGALPNKINEEMVKYVNDDSRLQAYFEEDKQIVEKRAQLMDKRDRLTKAAATMSTIQVIKRGPTKFVINAKIGPQGLGVSLAEEDGQVVIRGFRIMPDYTMMNPGQEAGMKLGDILEKLNGHPLFSIADAAQRIKECSFGGTVARFVVIRS